MLSIDNDLKMGLIHLCPKIHLKYLLSVDTLSQKMVAYEDHPQKQEDLSLITMSISHALDPPCFLPYFTTISPSPSCSQADTSSLSQPLFQHLAQQLTSYHYHHQFVQDSTYYLYQISTTFVCILNHLSLLLLSNYQFLQGHHRIVVKTTHFLVVFN